MRLYPPVTVIGQDYTGVKIVTVPNQSMTLRDILKRFIRKESLPVQQEGIYAENLGDLEKLARQDITVRMERAQELHNKLDRVRKAQDQKASPPSGGEPLKTPEGGGGVAPPTTDGKTLAT